MSLINCLGIYGAAALFCGSVGGGEDVDLIPLERLTDWTPGTRTGVPGGVQYRIDERPTMADGTWVNMVTAGADDTGGESCAALLNAQLAAGKLIYFPAGDFLINAEIVIPNGWNFKTIRGAGMDETTLIGASFVMGSGATDGTPIEVVLPMTRNSPTLSVVSSAGIVVGDRIRIDFENMDDTEAIEGGETIVFAVGGGADYLRRQITVVTAINGNDLTISPGIYHAPPPGLGARIVPYSNPPVYNGFEDFTIEDITNSSGIQMYRSYACWVSGVRMLRLENYGVEFNNCFQCEVRHSEIRERLAGGFATSGSAILLNFTCACLIEDNITVNVIPVFEVNSGSSGNLFQYNLGENVPKGVGAGPGFGMTGNHGPHTDFNLFQGNIASNYNEDGYFGSSSNNTVFRNWLTTSWYGATNHGFGITLKRFTRKAVLVGNVIGLNGFHEGNITYGQPAIGNSNAIGTAQPSLGDFWWDWPLHFNPSDSNEGQYTGVTGVHAADVITAPGSAFANDDKVFFSVLNGTAGELLIDTPYAVREVSGDTFKLAAVRGGAAIDFTTTDISNSTIITVAEYQETDLDVEATTLERLNYLYDVNGAAGELSPGNGGPLLDSLTGGKPPWWDDDAGEDVIPWPPFDPTNPNAASYDSIPAGWRYTRDATFPASAPVITQTPPGPATVGIEYSYQIDATDADPGFYAFYNPPFGTGWAVSNTGLITGTPTTPGVYGMTIDAFNRAGKDSEGVFVTVT